MEKLTNQVRRFTDIPDEVFKEIPNTKGYYWISNKGGLWSTRTNKLCKWSKNAKNYLFTTRTYKDRVLIIVAHKEVTRAFLGNRPEGTEVNHIDGDKNNNSVENLEYITHQENIDHARINGLMSGQKGSDHHRSKLSEEDILPILRSIRSGRSQREIAKEYSVDSSLIGLIVNNKIWTHVVRPETLTPEAINSHTISVKEVDTLDRFMRILELTKTCRNIYQIGSIMGISISSVSTIWSKYSPKRLKCQELI